MISHPKKFQKKISLCIVMVSFWNSNSNRNERSVDSGRGGLWIPCRGVDPGKPCENYLPDMNTDGFLQKQHLALLCYWSEDKCLMLVEQDGKIKVWALRSVRAWFNKGLKKLELGPALWCIILSCCLQSCHLVEAPCCSTSNPAPC